MPRVGTQPINMLQVPGTSGATVTDNNTGNVTLVGTLAQLNAELASGRVTIQYQADA